jgi:hypothetical protein
MSFKPILQIHLLTAIALMFAAGALIKLNLGEIRPLYEDPLSQSTGIIYRDSIFLYREFGRPFPVNPHFKRMSPSPGSGPIFAVYPRLDPNFPVPIPDFLWRPIAADLAIALATLAAVAIASEFFLRRHYRNKLRLAAPSGFDPFSVNSPARKADVS